MTEALNSLEVGQEGVMLSPEDVAWADSCLSKDPDMLDSGWNSLKDALLETLDAQHHTSYERNNSLEVANMEICSSGNASNIHKIEEKSVVSNAGSVRNSPEHALSETFSTQYDSSPYDRDDSSLVLPPLVREIHSTENINDILDSDIRIAATSDGAEPNSNDHLNDENADDFWSKHKIEDIFLPTYDENSRDLGVSDSEFDLVFQESQLEQSTVDIFKIWDFDIPPEENDLMKQLNKALAENSLERTPPVSDDSEAWKGLQDESLDDLISGISDLALSPKSD